LDFVCFERRLVIEIDGIQHMDSKRDEKRDAVLASEGFQVIRYWNNDVLQRRSAILEDLFAKLEIG
jgi:very-short-patch-repair endonuclease